MRDLADAIARAQNHWTNELPCPCNEAAVCDWVVRPLLEAAGYAYYEIEPQATDDDGTIPDYTIRAGRDHKGADATWYLEAKFWRVALQAKHRDQALSYARRNGRRWAVLTNGETWQLLDAQNVAAPVALLAELADTQGMERLLNAISPEVMRSGEVEALAKAAGVARPASRVRAYAHQKPFPRCATFEELESVVRAEQVAGWTPFLGMAQTPVSRFSRPAPDEPGMVRVHFINRRIEAEETVVLSALIAATGDENSRLWLADAEYTYPPSQALRKYRPSRA